MLSAGTWLLVFGLPNYGHDLCRLMLSAKAPLWKNHNYIYWLSTLGFQGRFKCFLSLVKIPVCPGLQIGLSMFTSLSRHKMLGGWMAVPDVVTATSFLPFSLRIPPHMISSVHGCKIIGLRVFNTCIKEWRKHEQRVWLSQQQKCNTRIKSLLEISHNYFTISMMHCPGGGIRSIHTDWMTSRSGRHSCLKYTARIADVWMREVAISAIVCRSNG